MHAVLPSMRKARRGLIINISSTMEGQMKRFTRAAIFICSGLLFIIVACQTPAGRTAGQAVDDATITTKVKAKLFDQSFLRGFSISVDTFEGAVTLTGAVQTEAQKNSAGTIAGSVYGVKGVNNLIVIKKNNSSHLKKSLLVPYLCWRRN